jgi:hypothetical protein
MALCDSQSLCIPLHATTGADGSTAVNLPCNANGLCDVVSSMVYWDQGDSQYLFLYPAGEDVDWCYWDSSAGNFVCTPYASADQTDHLAPSGHPGGDLVLTFSPANNDTAILWAMVFPKTPANQAYVDPNTCAGCFAGYLRAYLIGNSLQATPPSAPSASNYPDFSFTAAGRWTSTDTWYGSPLSQFIVANGSVYIPTYTGGVIVYH